MPQSAIDVFVQEVSTVSGHVLRAWEEDGAFAIADFRGMHHVMGWALGIGTEHHAVVPFALRSACILTLRDDRPVWSAAPDADLDRWLQTVPAFQGLAERLSWTAQLPGGAPPLRLVWTIQLRPVAGGHGHLVLRAGDYGGRTGLSELLGVIEWLSSAIPRAAHPEAEFLVAPAFDAQARRALGLAPGAMTRAPSAEFVPVGGSATPAQARKLVDALQSAAGPLDEDEYTRRVNAGGKAFLRGKYDEFIAIWEGIARDFPEHRGSALHQAGNGYFAKKDYARAIQYYEAALAAGGGDVAEINDDIASARKKMK